jgi:hypothetical protein
MIQKLLISDVKGTISVEALDKRWHISLEVVKQTIEKTTQKGVRNFTHMSGTRRLRHLTQQLRYRPLSTVCVILIQFFLKFRR